MIEAHSFESIVKSAREKRQNINITLGILLCKPDNPLSSEILNNLEYFHFRSARHINFYCCGYSGYSSRHNDAIKVSIAGTNWFFSNEAFIGVLSALEAQTKWKYSGETDLLILDVDASAATSDTFAIKSALVCNLEDMINNNAITSVRAFIETIIRHFSSRSDATAYTLSNTLGIDAGANILKSAITWLLPEQVRQFYLLAENFAIERI